MNNERLTERVYLKKNDKKKLDEFVERALEQNWLGGQEIDPQVGKEYIRSAYKTLLEEYPEEMYARKYIYKIKWE